MDYSVIKSICIQDFFFHFRGNYYHNVKDIAEREGPHHLQEVREFQIWSWFFKSILDLKLKSFEC
jgi:hypothetical protein